MERMTKEFKNQSNIEIMESIMKKSMIEKVGHGIYLDSSKIEDSYFVFGLELPNIICSHMTTLCFHGLSIKAPNDKYDIREIII